MEKQICDGCGWSCYSMSESNFETHFICESCKLREAEQKNDEAEAKQVKKDIAFEEDGSYREGFK